MTRCQYLCCGVIAGPLFVIMFLIEGATRANYDPLRHPVSSLALGDSGWMQVANFIVTGALIVLFARGLWRVLRDQGYSPWGALFIACLGVGLIGAGVFPTDPVSGYPPGTPNLLPEPTMQSQIHDLFSIGVFGGLPLACFVFTRLFARRREWGWSVYSLVSGLGMLAAFAYAGVGFSQVSGLVDFGGLFQRISLIAGLSWLTLLALHVLHCHRSSARLSPAS